MIEDLFKNNKFINEKKIEFSNNGVTLIRDLFSNQSSDICSIISSVSEKSNFRNMITPFGKRINASMTNCGDYGWFSDLSGYRYIKKDPTSNNHWPKIPPLIYNIASEAARIAGYEKFNPNSCLINRYGVGDRISLHQDKNEGDISQPIVSLSLGLPVLFLFGGRKKNDPCTKIALNQGDAMVWGGISRLNYHGTIPLKSSIPPWPFQECIRYNLTLRYVDPLHCN